MNILVLAAHPDDEVLGCGGTIARRSREGHAVTIAILGEGITSRYRDRQEVEEERLSELQDDSRKVGELLGAREVLSYGVPDNRFDSVPLLEVVHKVEEIIDRVGPDIVYTQNGGDLNIDHQLLFKATLAATRPVPGHSVRAVYAYEVASSTEWAFQKFAPDFRPSVFVDIEETLEIKIEAMQAYETERRPFPHPRSPEALRAQARRWGSTAGLEAAEAFAPIRIIE